MRGGAITTGAALIAILLATGSIHCKKSTSSATPACTFAVVGRVVTDEDLALPILAKLEDIEKPKRESNGCEYGDEYHKAKLGPLDASYTAWDYKGLPVTTGAVVTLSSSTCSGPDVKVTVTTVSELRIRHDPKRDVYIITDHYGGPRLDAGDRDDEKRNGIVVRLGAKPGG